MVIWNGLNPSLIGIQVYDVEAVTRETRKIVDNDRFINIKTKEYKQVFNQATRKGNLRGVADASFNREISPTVAAAAWVLETKDGIYQWEGLGLMKAENNSSYGGELYGLYLILRFVQEMWEENRGFIGKIRIKCDNITSVRDSMKKSLKMRSQQSFQSLNRAVRKHIADLEKAGLEIESGHIKGHQDDIHRYKTLLRWSQLNSLVDEKARGRLAEYFYRKIRLIHLYTIEKDVTAG